MAENTDGPSDPTLHGPVVHVAVASHPGNVRRRNEDHAGMSVDGTIIEVPLDGQVFSTAATGVPVLVAVADGLGGHPFGDAASRLAVESLLGAAPAGSDALVVATHEANAAVYGAMVDRQKQTMGTTIAALLVHAGGAAVLNVGDSPVFVFVDGELVELSVMDSLSAEDDPHGWSSNVVTQTLGGRDRYEEVAPHLHEFEPEGSCRLLVCTDGLTNYADPGDVATVVAAGDPSAAATALIDLALAGGGGDNITVAVVDVELSPVRAHGELDR